MIRCHSMHMCADRPETRPLREKYAGVVPAEGSVVDLLVRAKDKQTGQPLKAHQIVAQVRRRRGGANAAVLRCCCAHQQLSAHVDCQ
jgi:hypothetical protein